MPQAQYSGIIARIEYLKTNDMGTTDEAVRRRFIIDEEIDLFEKQVEDDVQKELLLKLRFIREDLGLEPRAKSKDIRRE